MRATALYSALGNGPSQATRSVRVSQWRVPPWTIQPIGTDAFRRASDAGLRRTVYESSGPEGVWDAVQLLGADRIDHGVRVIKDPLW